MPLSNDLFQFFNPTEDVSVLSGDLPHWRQDGVPYFVTFRLSDSLPQGKIEEWKQEREIWLKTHSDPRSAADQRDYFERFPQRLQQWLDLGAGSCVLGLPEVKTLVETALRHFDGDRYYLDQYVVASNHVHVHVLVTPHRGHTLSAILHSWKSFTAHKIIKHPEAKQRLQESRSKKDQIGGHVSILGSSSTAAETDQRRDASATSLSVWQKESFDHLVRSAVSLEKFRAYIVGHVARTS